MGTTQKTQTVEESFRTLPMLKDLSLETLLERLGLFDEERELERLAIFFQFQKSCEGVARPKSKLLPAGAVPPVSNLEGFMLPLLTNYNGLYRRGRRGGL